MEKDSINKDDTEWPALSDTVNQTPTTGHNSRSVRIQSTDTNNNNNNNDNGATGNDSSKENKQETNGNSGARRKKKQAKKVQWQPLQIETTPYRKRGTGRYNNEFSKSAEYSKKNRGRNDYTNGSENGRGNSRNAGFRGRRGRPHGNYRSGREDHTSPTNGVMINGVTFYPQTFTDTTLKNNIKYQMEYYFSDENLRKDFFLRRRIDDMGFAPISFFLTFPRIMRLNVDLNMLTEAIMESNKLEIQGDFVRRVVDPLGWRIRYPGDDFVNQTALVGSNSYVIPFVGADSTALSVNDESNITAVNGDVSPVSAHNDANISLPNEEDSNNIDLNGDVSPLVHQIENLQLNGASSFASDVQYSPDFNEPLDNAMYPATASPPELDIVLNGVFMDNTIVNNGDDYYSQTSSPLEQTNGYDFVPGAVYNDLIYYDTNQLMNQAGTYFPHMQEVLSSSLDTSSNSDASHNVSPEPSR